MATLPWPHLPSLHLQSLRPLGHTYHSYTHLGHTYHHYTLLGAVQVALGADEVPAAKPAADGLLLCCERLGVDPASSVYVGDSPTDGQAASP